MRLSAASAPRHSQSDRRPGPGGLSLMSGTIAKVGMKPPHPGAFIREEILEPHGLNLSTGADVRTTNRTCTVEPSGPLNEGDCCAHHNFSRAIGSPVPFLSESQQRRPTR